MKTTYANKHLGYLADILFGPRGTFVELRFRHITGNYKLWHNDVGVGTSVCSSISVIVFSASHPLPSSAQFPRLVFHALMLLIALPSLDELAPYM